MRTPEILGALARRTPTLAATAMMLAGLLAGCGQTGPLYLPAPGQAEKPARAREIPPEVVNDQLESGANVSTPATE